MQNSSGHFPHKTKKPKPPACDVDRFRLLQLMTEQIKGVYPEKQTIANAKFRALGLSLNLLKHNPNSPLRAAYKNTVYCTDVRTVTTSKDGVKHSTSYCKNRWCAQCERNRMGIRINGYAKDFEAMADPYFVTLTKKTVVASALLDSIQLMNDVWRKILKSKEGRRRKPKGIRKSECTFGKILWHYHYHFHVIIDGKENAKWLYTNWLKEMGSLSSYKAQDVKPADKGSLIELFKYFSKEEIKLETDQYKRLDVIFTAIRGKRVIQPFGGVKEVIEEVNSESEELSEKILSEVEKEIEEKNAKEVIAEWDEERVVNFQYIRKHSDWISEEGERYSGFDPDRVVDREGKLDRDFRKKHEVKEDVQDNQVSNVQRFNATEWLTKWPEPIDNWSKRKQAMPRGNLSGID